MSLPHSFTLYTHTLTWVVVVRLADFIVVEQLVASVCEISGRLLQVLSWPREPRPLVFLSRIHFTDESKIIFDPVEAQIRESVSNTLDSTIALVNHVPRVIFNVSSVTLYLKV